MSGAGRGHASDVSAMLDAADVDGADVEDIRQTLYDDLAEDLEAICEQLDAVAVRGPDAVESRVRDCEVDLRELARVLEAADGRLTDGEVADAMYRDEIHQGGGR
jgi:hypothetical protein